MHYLIERRFVGAQPAAVAKFLISRKGLSKWMVGEFIGNLQKPFNLQVLRSVLRPPYFCTRSCRNPPTYFCWTTTITSRKR